MTHEQRQERVVPGAGVLLVDIEPGERRRCPTCGGRMVALAGLAVAIHGVEPCDSCVIEQLGDSNAEDLLAVAGMPACDWCGRVACKSRSYHRRLYAGSETAWRKAAG